jgi:hypothetical protein
MTGRGADKRAADNPEITRRDPDGRGVTPNRLVDEERTVGYDPHGAAPPVEQPDARPERGLTIDAREEQIGAATHPDPTPDTGLAADDQRHDLPDAQPG